MFHALRSVAALSALSALFAVLAAGPTQAATGDAGTPRQVVDGFHAALLSVMKDAERLGVAGRFERLAPEIRRRFDSRTMIALASGRYWGQADAAGQESLVEAFRRFSAATYAARFDGYSGQSFETVGVEAGPRGTQIVRSRIVSPDSNPVRLSYVLRRDADGWRIIDVLVDDGISELAVRRSEYAAILKKDGVRGLVRLLNDKADNLLRS